MRSSWPHVTAAYHRNIKTYFKVVIPLYQLFTVTFNKTYKCVWRGPIKLVICISFLNGVIFIIPRTVYNALNVITTCMYGKGSFVSHMTDKVEEEEIYVILVFILIQCQK